MARSFASGDYLQAASNSIYDSAQGTVALFFEASSITGNPAMIGRHNSGNSNNGLNIYLSAGSPNSISGVSYYGLGTAGAIGFTSSLVTAGVPHHVVFSWDQANGATQYLYFDGVLVGTAANTNAWSFAAQPIRMGRDADPFWQDFLGNQFGWGWWNQQLTLKEVFDLYSGAAPSTIRRANLVGAWNPISLTDFSGSKNDLTVGSGTAVAADDRIISAKISPRRPSILRPWSNQASELGLIAPRRRVMRPPATAAFTWQDLGQGQRDPVLQRNEMIAS